jgi:hypothetical protein
MLHHDPPWASDTAGCEPPPPLSAPTDIACTCIHPSLLLHTRGELGPEEDATKLTPAAILGRRDLTLVLMVAILDPPRSEAISAIEVAHKAGITVKMITGEGLCMALMRAVVGCLWHW